MELNVDNPERSIFLKSAVNQRMDDLLNLAVNPKVTHAPKVDLKSIVSLRKPHASELILKCSLAAWRQYALQAKQTEHHCNFCSMLY